MQAKLSIKNGSFNNAQGQEIKWEKIVITGVLNGDVYELPLDSLNKSEKMFAKALILSDSEPAQVVARSANDDEIDEFFKQRENTDSDKIDLDD